MVFMFLEVYTKILFLYNFSPPKMHLGNQSKEKELYFKYFQYFFPVQQQYEQQQHQPKMAISNTAIEKATANRIGIRQNNNIQCLQNLVK